jgi:pimeloyl-ACP methyl ester carboxylesterase
VTGTAVAMPELTGVRHRSIALSTAVTVHVAEAGLDTAPAVLALHGWPQHWYAWRRVIPLLDSYRFIAPDLRGLGWSGWPEDGDFRKARMAEDAVALLDALGIERALLLGHDWGGWVGFLAALARPERWSGLVAVAIPHPWQPRTRVLRHAHRLAYQPLVAAAPRQMPWLASRALRLMGGDENAVFVETYRDPRRAEAASRLYRDFLLREALAGVRGRLSVPTRLLYGTRDPLGTAFAHGLERHGDDARTVMLDGAGHRIPEERPDAVAAAVRELALLELDRHQ